MVRVSKMVWRPTTYRPHVLRLDEHTQLIDRISGKIDDVFISYKIPLAESVRLAVDIADPRDLGLRYLVIYGIMKDDMVNMLDEEAYTRVNALLHLYIDEMHPMTPYRFFVLEPGMLSRDPIALFQYMADSNVQFTGITLS